MSHSLSDFAFSDFARNPRCLLGKVGTQFRAEEVYLDAVLSCRSYLQGHPGGLLPAGVHQIPFSFRLPPSLPSSYEGQYGHIRYFAAATLQRRKKWNVSTRRNFTVRGYEPLGPGQSGPAQLEETSPMAVCCCVPLGEVFFRVSIPARGVVAGDEIFTSGLVRYRNVRRTRKISRVTVKLLQFAVFRAESALGFRDTRSAVEVVAKTRVQNEPAAEEFIWEREPLAVPSTLPGRLANCALMHLSYAIRFKVDGVDKSLLPLTVATVPVDFGLSPARVHFRTPTISSLHSREDPDDIEVFRVAEGTRLDHVLVDEEEKIQLITESHSEPLDLYQSSTETL